MKYLISIITKILIFTFFFQLYSNETPLEKNKNIKINFDNIHMVEYVRFVSKITNKNFIFDEQDLDFTVTIVSEEPASFENVMTVLLQELRIHNLILTEQGNQLIIHKNPKVNNPSSIVIQEQEEEPGNLSEIITQVFHLNTLESDKAGAIIRPLISSHAIMESIPETHHLIVTDLRSNVVQIAKLLKHLDSPSGGLVIGQYSANSELEKLQNLTQQIMAPLTKNTSFVIVPNRNEGCLFVISTPYLVERSLALLHYLDQKQNRTGLVDLDPLKLPPPPFYQNPKDPIKDQEKSILNENSRLESSGRIPFTPKESKFYIHKLQYRLGDAVLQQIKQIASSLQQVRDHEDLVATINTGEWLKESKALVFSGTPENLDKVHALTEQIDIPLRQVYIEMLIINTTVDDSLNYSVNWAAKFHGDNFSGSESFSSNGTNLNKALNSGDGSNLAGGAGFSLGVIGQKILHKGLGIEFGSIGALLNALHENHISNIVLSPKIVTEDNIPAQIFVGVNTPFKTQSILSETGDLITSNFEFRDVGTSLQVTPHLHNSDMITLDIFQERTDLITAPATSANARNVIGPSSRKNSTKTTVHVPSGFFVIISGLIENDTRKIKKQVPCLGSIPIIGAAFSDKSTEDNKRNLMIFIRPLIIDTDEEFQKITKNQQDIWKFKTQQKKEWVQEVEGTLDFLNLGGTMQEFPSSF